MPLTESSLEKNIESISRIATLASKLGVLIGGVCVVSYSLKINHFPQDLSVGDGFLFLMAAACFGVLYVLFTACFVALGVVLSPITRIVFQIGVWSTKLFLKGKDTSPILRLAPFAWSAVLPSLFAVLIIFGLGSRDPMAYWSLPLLAVTLYLFYSDYVSHAKQIQQIEIFNSSMVHSEEKISYSQMRDPEKLRRAQLVDIAAILVMPLLVSGVSGQLLDGSMRLAHVRIENPVVYLKEPYASLAPKSLISKDVNPLKDYTAFDDAVVLFKGFGKTTVISFQDETRTRKLEIPNEYLIVEDR